jgi:hypothetical protein
MASTDSERGRWPSRPAKGRPSSCSRRATNSGLPTGRPVNVPRCSARIAANSSGSAKERNPSFPSARGGVELPVQQRRRRICAKVRGGTGSGVLLGPRHKLSPNWIAFRVTKRRPQMRSIDRAGIVAILPKMSYPMTAGVEVEGVTAVSAAQSHGEGLRLFGVFVVGGQPNLACFPHSLRCPCRRRFFRDYRGLRHWGVHRN